MHLMAIRSNKAYRSTRSTRTPAPLPAADEHSQSRSGKAPARPAGKLIGLFVCQGLPGLALLASPERSWPVEHCRIGSGPWDCRRPTRSMALSASLENPVSSSLCSRRAVLRLNSRHSEDSCDLLVHDAECLDFMQDLFTFLLKYS